MKVISFCLYGNKPQYIIGAIKNAELAKKLFPDWQCWFYMDDLETSNEDEDAISGPNWRDLYNYDNVATIFQEQYHKHHLMLARFLPAGKDYSNPEYLYPRDDHVDVMLSRDCDSRLSAREVSAVNQWLKSDKQFLVMKDHPWHAGVPILGGLWGAKHHLLPNIESMIDDFLKEDPRNEWQCDQRFLTQKVWPLVQNTAMVFDPFYGGLNYAVPRDGNNFCGATHDENDKIPQEQINMLQAHWRP